MLRRVEGAGANRDAQFNYGKILFGAYLRNLSLSSPCKIVSDLIGGKGVFSSPTCDSRQPSAIRAVEKIEALIVPGW